MFDPWINDYSRRDCFPQLFAISIILKVKSPPFGTHPGVLLFEGILKDDNIEEFRALLMLISNWRATLSEDVWRWSIETSGVFSVKSLYTFLEISSSLNNKLYDVLWKSKCPRRVNNIQISSFVHRFVLPILRRENFESHSFWMFVCSFSLEFIVWFFQDAMDNVHQVFIDPSLSSKAILLWVNEVKSIVSELWFREKSTYFTSILPLVRFDSVRLKFSSWCSYQSFLPVSQFKIYITDEMPLFSNNNCG